MKTIYFIIVCMVLSCKTPGSQSGGKAVSTDKNDCRSLISKKEEVELIAFSSDLSKRLYLGQVSESQYDSQVLNYLSKFPSKSKNKARFHLTQGNETAATAFVMSLILSKRSLDEKTLRSLEAMNIPRDAAAEYISSIRALIMPHLDALSRYGMNYLGDSGWTFIKRGEIQSTLEYDQFKKDLSFLNAMNFFFGPSITSQLLNNERDLAMIVEGHVFEPMASGELRIKKRSEWERQIKLQLTIFKNESENFIKSAKAVGTYSNLMTGQPIKFFGGERGYQGKTGPEIQLESSYKILIKTVNGLRFNYGVHTDMAESLTRYMQVLNRFELSQLEKGIRELDMAQRAAVASIFVPVVIWAAPYAASFGLGSAAGSVAAVTSAKLALLPLAFGVGAATVSASIRTANLGGSFSCNLYEQFSETATRSLVAAPFIASLPIVAAGGSVAASAVTNGSLSVATASGVINLGVTSSLLSVMVAAGVSEARECYRFAEAAELAARNGDSELVKVQVEKTYQACAAAGIDLSFAAVTGVAMAKPTYRSITRRSWREPVARPCRSLSLTGGCSPPKPHEKILEPDEIAKVVTNSNRLHSNISNAERIDVIRNFPVNKMNSAPGHTLLRNPEAVKSMGQKIASSSDKGASVLSSSEPIVVNVYTTSNAKIRAIELMDGNHRLAAGLYAESINPGRGWRTINDIPRNLIEVRVNGYNTEGYQVPRWIPLEIAKNSNLSLSEYRVIPPEWGAKGPTAEISSSVPSISSKLRAEDRGQTMEYVLRMTLERLSNK